LRIKVKALNFVAKSILVLVCLVLILPGVIRLYPSLVGADGSYVVFGGSMEPTLSVGDLTFTEKVDPAEIKVGDVVAVRADSGVYTHRVVEKTQSDEGTLFRLKGDANEDPDTSYVNGSELLGRTMFALPMGYLYTSSGYILVISAPLMILAGYQSIKIYKLYTRKRQSLKVKKRRKFSIVDTTSTLLLLILVAGCTNMISPRFASVSGGFFTDTEASSSNVVGAGTWRVSSSISCTVSNSNITLGENVTISGSITPGRSAEVTLDVSTDDGNSWTLLTMVTSAADGSYQYKWTPKEAGAYVLKASWNGDGGYFGADSETVNVLVSELNDE
jgi:signal peptidase